MTTRVLFEGREYDAEIVLSGNTRIYQFDGQYIPEGPNIVECNPDLPPTPPMNDKLAYPPDQKEINDIPEEFREDAKGGEDQSDEIEDPRPNRKSSKKRTS